MKNKYNQKGGLEQNSYNILMNILNINNIPEGKERNNYINKIDKDIQELIPDFSDINNTTEFRNYYYYINDAKTKKDSTIYSPKFTQIIEKLNSIILSNDKSSIIYSSIGKVFSNFNCKNNNYKERFGQYIIDINKIRVWNKAILKLKLYKCLNNIILHIGNCDASLFSRNTPNSFKIAFPKTSITLQEIKNDFDNVVSQRTLFPDQEPRVKLATPPKKITSSAPTSSAPTSSALTSSALTSSEPTTSQSNEFLIPLGTSATINLVRSQFLALKQLYDENCVTYKERQEKAKENPIYYKNPRFIAFVSVVTSSIFQLSSLTPEIQKNVAKTDLKNFNDFLKNNLSFLPVTAAAVATIASGLIVPTAAFLTIMLINKTYKTVTESEYYKSMNENYNINLEFIREKNNWRLQNPEAPQMTADCSISSDVNQYLYNFTTANQIENEYIELSSINYDNILNLSIYCSSTYKIICGTENIEDNLDTNTTTDSVSGNTENEEDSKISEEEQAFRTHLGLIASNIRDAKDRSPKPFILSQSRETQDAINDLRGLIKEYLKLKFGCNSPIKSVKTQLNPLLIALDNNDADTVKKILCGYYATGGKKSRKLRKRKTQKLRQKTHHRRR